jgi:hypothetical protein
VNTFAIYLSLIYLIAVRPLSSDSTLLTAHVVDDPSLLIYSFSTVSFDTDITVVNGAVVLTGVGSAIYFNLMYFILVLPSTSDSTLDVAHVVPDPSLFTYNFSSVCLLTSTIFLIGQVLLIYTIAPADGDGLDDGLGDILADGLADVDLDGDAEGEGDILADGLADADLEGDAEGDALADAEGDVEGLPPISSAPILHDVRRML